MKITFEQLGTHLKNPLSPIYLMTGDEAFLAQEAVTLIRTAAAMVGFQERKAFAVEAAFNWEIFLAEAAQQALFNPKILLELRLPATKINDAAKQALLKYTELASPDKILLITTDKLEAKHQNSAWYKKIEQQGTIITLWPLVGAKLQTWLQGRCQTQGLKINSEGLQILKELTEGNLAAAAQAIEKLKLHYGDAPLTAREILNDISQNSHYDIFTLVDNILAGNIPRTVAILNTLKNEAVEPTLILWALLREIRQIIQMQSALNNGEMLEKIFMQYRIWDSKKSFYRQAMQRYQLPQWYQLLQQASTIDATIKGAVQGNIWLALNQLCLQFSGLRR